VIDKIPDIIIGSWSCKQFIRKVEKRIGWSILSAVLTKDAYEIKPAVILQPSSAVLTESLDQIFTITNTCYEKVK